MSTTGRGTRDKPYDSPATMKAFDANCGNFWNQPRRNW